MRVSRLVQRLTAGLTVLAVSGAAALVGGMAANAAPPPADGPLTLTPATGLDTTVPTLGTPGGCPTTANAYNGTVTGPNDFNGTVVNTQSAGISFTDPFTVGFSNTMLAVSQSIGKPIVAGEYDISLNCVDDFDGTVFRTWTTAMYFTDATNWTATDPNASPSPVPSESPSPSPVPSESPSPSPVPSELPSPSPVPSESPSPSPSPAPGATATTTALSVIHIPLPFGLGGLVVPVAKVSPSNATGTIQFMNRNTNIGASVRVQGGIAIGHLMFLPRGSYSLTAVFTPKNPAKFNPSTSNTVKIKF